MTSSGQFGGRKKENVTAGVPPLVPIAAAAVGQIVVCMPGVLPAALRDRTTKDTVGRRTTHKVARRGCEEGEMRNVIVGLAASWALLCGCVVEAGPPAGASTSPSITAQALGPLSGDNQSMGFGVNDAGSVVGMSAGKGGERAFYWSKSRGLVQLTTSGTTGAAYAIAGKPGNIEYAVGYEESGGHRRAVIWVAPPSLSPVPLSDNGSLALGVNDAGTAVGSSGGTPVIWTRDGNSYTPTHIGFLPNQAEAYATAIDNDGIVVGYGYDSVTFRSRAFVRLPSGTLVPLDPVPGDVKSTAQAVSDKVGPTGSPLVYVAGSTTSAAGVQRAVRWKVDLATGNLLETKVLSQTWAEGVNGSGDVAGTLNGSRGKQSATLWRNDVYTTLPPPTGATGGTSRGIAQTATSPTYVVGQTTMNNWPRAVVWVVQ